MMAMENEHASTKGLKPRLVCHSLPLQLNHMNKFVLVLHNV